MAAPGPSEIVAPTSVAEPEAFRGIATFTAAVGRVALCSTALKLPNQWALNQGALHDLDLLSATNPPPDSQMIAARIIAHGPSLQDRLQRANAQLVMVPRGATDPLAILGRLYRAYGITSAVLDSHWESRMDALRRCEGPAGWSVLMVLQDGQPTGGEPGLAHTDLTHEQQQERLRAEQEQLAAECGAALVQLDIVPLLVLNAMRRLKGHSLLDTTTAVRLPAEPYRFGTDEWSLRLRARGRQLILGAGPANEAKPTLGVRRAIALPDPCLPA